MLKTLKAWIFEPEYQIVSALYLCRRMAARGGLQRWVSGFVWRRYVSGKGCNISPRAVIGADLHLPHPVGIVIGSECVIGDHVTLYQNVTIGRRNARTSGMPKIARHVVIYAGAVVVGDITIGDSAIIGANCVVDFDVPAGAVVRPPKPDLILRQ